MICFEELDENKSEIIDTAYSSSHTMFSQKWLSELVEEDKEELKYSDWYKPTISDTLSYQHFTAYDRKKDYLSERYLLWSPYQKVESDSLHEFKILTSRTLNINMESYSDKEMWQFRSQYYYQDDTSYFTDPHQRYLCSEFDPIIWSSSKFQNNFLEWSRSNCSDKLQTQNLNINFVNTTIQIDEKSK